MSTDGLCDHRLSDAPERCGRPADGHELASTEASNALYALGESRQLADRITYAMTMFGATRIEGYVWGCSDECQCNNARLIAVCPPETSAFKHLPALRGREWNYELARGESYGDDFEAAERERRILLDEAHQDGRLPVESYDD